MPGVVVPNGPPHQGLLDTVMKGLAVAKDVYGIRSDQIAIANAEDAQAGVLPASQRAAYAAKYNISDAPVAGAQPVKFRTGEGDEGVSTAYLSPKAPVVKPVAVPNVVVGGKTGTAFIDPTKTKQGEAVDLNDPNGPLISFVETAKAPKEPKTREVTVTNPDGSQTISIVPDVAGSTYSSAPKPPKPADEEDKYAKVMGLFEPTRGNRALQQSSVALVNIQNAKNLIQPYANNLDSMPQKQVGLLTSELEKIATGGAGSESGRQSIQAETFKSRLNDFMSSVNGEPQPAQLGAFLRDNVTYLNDLQASNQENVEKHYRHVWNANKGRLSQELQDRAHQENPDYFAWEKNPPAANGKLDAVASKPDTSGQSLADTATGIDKNIQTYASDHGLDYLTASKIIEARKAKGK